MASRSPRAYLTDIATVVAGASAAVVAAVVILQRVGPTSLSTEDPQRPVAGWEAFAAQGQRQGSVDAPVTIVQFGDYQCGACRAAEPHLEAIRRQYIDRILFVYRHWPLPSHDFAYPAARAAECANAQGRFWPFHEQLYSTTVWHTEDWRDVMLTFAENAAVSDLSEFDQCLSTTEPIPEIEADIAAARQLRARGTPTFLINGIVHLGVLDSLTLADMIQSQLSTSERNRGRLLRLPLLRR